MHCDVTRGNGARTKHPRGGGGRPREEAARERSRPQASRERPRRRSPPRAGGGGEVGAVVAGAGGGRRGRTTAPWVQRGAARRAGRLPGDAALRGLRGRPRGSAVGGGGGVAVGVPPLPPPPPRRPAALPVSRRKRVRYAQPKIGPGPSPGVRPPRWRLLTAGAARGLGGGPPSGEPRVPLWRLWPRRLPPVPSSLRSHPRAAVWQPKPRAKRCQPGEIPR